MNYVSTRKLWNRNNVVIDNIFAYNVAIEIMQQEEDFEPKSVHECRQRNDCQNGRMQFKLNWLH